MLWLLVAVGAFAVLIGLWLRVPAVLVASMALAATTVVLMTLGQRPLLEAIVFIFTLLTTLQVGYLAGVILSSAWLRVASRHPPQVSTSRR